MRRTGKLIVASLALAASTSLAGAGITIDLNGFPAHTGLQIGDGVNPLVYQSFSSPGASISLGTLLPNTTYNMDWYHNSGVGSSDSYFITGATGDEVVFVSNNQYNAGPASMATGFTPGDSTIYMNTQTVTYNANNVANVSGQTGTYYINGSTGAIGANAGPQIIKALPGYVSVDNLYNPGQSTEDYAFFVGDGTTSAMPGFEQYAGFSGLSVSPKSIIAHFKVESDHSLGTIYLSYKQPVFNTATVQSGPTTWEYTFDIVLTPGNAGQLIADFENGQNQTFGATGDAVKGDGSPWAGSVVVGDVSWAPKLAQAGDLYWFVTTGGPSNSTFSTISGTLDGSDPVNLTITATLIPEPASLALLAAGGLLMLRRRSVR